MIMYSIFCLILFSYQLSSFSAVSAKNTKRELRPLVKRGENGFQACLDNFEIHSDKIIRTQDSRNMGAKYINERDVSSRNDCLRLCCETEFCDVFVYEEKSPGSCYLFECGTPDDFKCKFTRHKNYTSAVLAINRHLTELESQIKFTQHEHELSRLRDPIEPAVSVASVIKKTTTMSPDSKETLQLVPVPPSDHQHNHSCSRFQFACHSKGECIAIYNACDGIPQCSDGSDEAPELNCPVPSGTTASPKPFVNTFSPQSLDLKPVKSEAAQINSLPHAPANIPAYQSNSENPQGPWPQQQQFMKQYPDAENQMGNNGYPANMQQNLNQEIMQNPRVNYGREGEGMVHNENQNWQYQYHPSSGGSQIFTHKGNGLVQQAERYPQHPYKSPDTPTGNFGQYNDQNQNDYAKYNYMDNPPYRGMPNNQMNNNWPVIHKQHDTQMGSMLDEGLVDHNPEVGHPNMMPPDYYYEDPYRSRGQVPHMQRFPYQNGVPNLPQNEQTFQPLQKSHPVIQNEPISKISISTTKNINPNQEQVLTQSPQIITTVKPKYSDKHHTSNAVHNSHRKMEKFMADVVLKETSFSDAEMEGHISNPSGAILSLTFGLCITGIMVVLVGCRMRMVQKRMRRGGKSPYAHDADFLVNGMYL